MKHQASHLVSKVSKHFLEPIMYLDERIMVTLPLKQRSTQKQSWEQLSFAQRLRQEGVAGGEAGV